MNRPPWGALLISLIAAVLIVVILNVINRAIWRTSNLFALLVEIIIVGILVFGVMAFVNRKPRI